MDELHDSAMCGFENHPRLRTIGCEKNLEARPYFEMRSGRGNSRRVMRSYSTAHVAVNGAKRMVEQVWEVRASGDLGLPGGMDQDVYMALITVVQQQGGMPEDGEVAFSVYELVQILNWGQSGRSYERVRACLDRMASTTIRCQRAWWRAASGSYISDTFSLFGLRVRHESRLGRHRELHAVKFHPLVVESYRQGLVTFLDSEYYFSLHGPVAKRLYRVLSVHCVRAWTVNMFELRDLVPLASYSYASQVERALCRAHEELIDSGFLADITIDRWRHSSASMVRYEISPTFAARRLAQALEQDPASSQAVKRLVGEKVKRDRAYALVHEYGPQHCIKYVDLLVHQRGLRKDRAGALVWAIEHPEESSWWEEVAASRRSKSSDSSPSPAPVYEDGESRGSDNEDLSEREMLVGDWNANAEELKKQRQRQQAERRQKDREAVYDLLSRAGQQGDNMRRLLRKVRGRKLSPEEMAKTVSEAIDGDQFQADQYVEPIEQAARERFSEDSDEPLELSREQS